MIFSDQGDISKDAVTFLVESLHVPVINETSGLETLLTGDNLTSTLLVNHCSKYSIGSSPLMSGQLDIQRKSK